MTTIDLNVRVRSDVDRAAGVLDAAVNAGLAAAVKAAKALAEPPDPK